MNIAINPEHFTNAAVYEEKRSIFHAVDMLKAANFRHFDMCTASSDEAFALREHLDKNGLCVIQSHMPMNRYKRGDFNEFYKSVMLYAENAKILGSKILVAHADEFDYKNKIFSEENVIEFNYSLFYDLVNFAAKNNMRVAFENVFWESTQRIRYCSRIEEILKILDRFNSESVGVCWDTGHARMQYGDRDNEALALIGDKVICTHVHDNYYERDLHIFPFLGNINWKEFMQTLKKVGYRGDLSFEMCYDNLPDTLLAEYLKALYRTGEYMINEL